MLLIKCLEFLFDFSLVSRIKLSSSALSSDSTAVEASLYISASDAAADGPAYLYNFQVSFTSATALQLDAARVAQRLGITCLSPIVFIAATVGLGDNGDTISRAGAGIPSTGTFSCTYLSGQAIDDAWLASPNLCLPSQNCTAILGLICRVSTERYQTPYFALLCASVC